LELKRLKRDPDILVHEVFQLVARFPGIKNVGVEATGFQKAFLRVFEEEGRRRGRFLPILKLERDTNITKRIRIASRLQPPWMAGQMHALRTCEALDDFLEEAERFRPEVESQHDDLLDAVADLYQVRGMPVARDEPEEDRDERLRRAFEEEQRRRHPHADRLHLRNAWGMHLRQQAEAEQRELEALGAGRDEMM